MVIEQEDILKPGQQRVSIKVSHYARNDGDFVSLINLFTHQKLPMKTGGFIYILTNKLKTVLYVGVTSNLRQRIWEHVHHENENSFTDQYNVTFLVYYEWFDTITTAIEREKQMKRWSRIKKIALMRNKNPEWRFLNEEVYDEVYSLLY